MTTVPIRTIPSPSSGDRETTPKGNYQALGVKGESPSRAAQSRTKAVTRTRTCMSIVFTCRIKQCFYFQGTGTKGSLCLEEDSLMTTTSRRHTSSQIKPTCSSRSLQSLDTGKASVDLVLVLMPHGEKRSKEFFS